MIDRCMKAASAAALAVALAWAGPASAQATRTWVSGIGDDVNPCSRTAPCRTFAGAISKTAAGGEINCLDPGAYGAVTITKSLSIVCQYTQAGVLATSGTNGITVNAAATDVVFLSGLDINGAGTGGTGIRVLAAGSVHIQNSAIYGFRGGSALGVSIAPGAATQVTIADTTITNNGTGATGGGILVRPSGSGSARLVMRSVLIRNNTNNGLSVDTTGNTGSSVTLMIDDSQFVGSSANGLALIAPAGSGNVQGIMTDAVVALTSGSGISGNGSGVVLRVAGTSISANATGISVANSASIQSYGTNRLDGNGVNGAFTGTILPQR
jgi:hypothetical protein